MPAPAAADSSGGQTLQLGQALGVEQTPAPAAVATVAGG